MDHGYDPTNEEMLQRLNEWAERIAEKQLSKELEHVPDTVGFMACLQFAARKVALRRDLMSSQMAIKIFSNLLEDINPDNSAQA